jgi:hypothetical protein
VRSVEVGEHDAPDGIVVPVFAARRGGHALAHEGLADAEDAAASCDVPEDARHHGHLILIHHEVVPRGVVAVAVGRGVAGYDFALAGAAQLAPAGALGGLGPLELGELVEDTVRELALGSVVSALVEGA